MRKRGTERAKEKDLTHGEKRTVLRTTASGNPLCVVVEQVSTMANVTTNVSSVGCYPCIDTDFFFPSVSAYVLLSFPANGWAVWLMTSSAAFLTDRMEAFEFNLVLCELLFCLASPAVCVGLYLLGGLADKFMIPIIAITFVMRPMFQCCLCVERYLAVIHPVVYLRFKLRYRLFCCGLVWMWIAQFAVVTAFLCIMTSLVFLSVCTAVFMLTFLLNSFCCLSVLRALRRAGPGEGNKERGEEGVSTRLKRNAFRSVLIIQATVVVGYVPVVVATLLVGRMAVAVVCQVHPLTLMMSLWCGLVHPVLYLRRARKLPCQRGALRNDSPTP